jgi:hypothetical protein
MNTIQKKPSQYLGTEIDHKWWRRYSKGGFSTRGIGEYWIKDGSLFFQHRARQKPICFPLQNIVEVILCPCKQRFRIGNKPVIKLVWQMGNRWLSSGFALSEGMEEASGLLASMRAAS